MTKNNLCLTTTGSGGHILPAISIAEKWKKKYPDAKIIFIGTQQKIDKYLLKSNNFIQKFIPLPLKQTPLKSIRFFPVSLFKMLIAFFQALTFLYQHSIQKVITTGGFAAIPVALAAKILNIEIEIYELNFLPGKTTRS